MISYRIGESSNDLLMVKVENDYYSKVKFKKLRMVKENM